ncbi:HepT-like ribonuclease domain-containing protein [Segatella copri]
MPWQDVIGIRNHIAHGYFDIDGDIVFDVIKNNLDDLLAAINYFISKFKVCIVTTLPPHALKGQKHLAQGNSLGIRAISLAPCKGKSFEVI